MLIYSIGASVDGFIYDRAGDFNWSAPTEELFRFHLQMISELGGYVMGRKLYEAMLVWESDSAPRPDEYGVAFAEKWIALPKTVFSRTRDSVQGNARLARGPVGEEIAAVLAATDKDVQIGGATMAAEAFNLGLIAELRIMRYPVVVGGGMPHLPPVANTVPLELIETRLFAPQVVYERYRCLYPANH